MTYEEFRENEKIILESEVELQNIQIGILKRQIEKLTQEKEKIIQSMECTLAFLDECKSRNGKNEDE